MKIKFTESPKGREYKKGDEVDFVGSIEEGYARKYVDRGWAEEVKAKVVPTEEEKAYDAEAAPVAAQAQALRSDRFKGRR